MYTVKDISLMCNGELLQGANNDHAISDIITDSRKIFNPSNALFVVLVTDSRNAHKYIPIAYEKGIRHFLVQEKVQAENYPDATFILTDNSLKALQQLVAKHRSKFDIPVIGVTGSNGKTIVKEWLSQLLTDETVIKNPKSYNSQLGVSISVWPMNTNHTMGVFEAGISQENEMQTLQEVIQPSIGVFTMIGAAHDKGFNNTRDKINEKLKLFEHCKQLVYCKDHEEVDEAVQKKFEQTELQLFTWGFHKEADLCIQELSSQNRKTTIRTTYKNEELSVTIPFLDKAYIDNAITCWLTLLALGKDQAAFQDKFEQLPVVSMRLELKEGINNCTLINDSYSSDTASLRIALDFLMQQQQHDKKSLILSDILQHKKTNELLKKIASISQNYKLYRAFFIGPELSEHRAFFDKLPFPIHFYNDTTSFLASFEELQFQDEAILIKGARPFAFEKVVNRLEDKIHKTVLSINLSAVIDNINVFRKRLKPKTKIMAMVKAFSYGSGTYEIANVLQHHGVDYLAVAYVDEGIELRRNGIILPVLVLNPSVSSLAAMIHHRLEPEVYSVELLQSFIHGLKSQQLKLPIHIKLDTGMHRLGVEETDLKHFIHLILENKNLFEVKSIFSHLVGSDDKALDDFTKLQAERFERMSNIIETDLGYKVIKHLCNSNGASRHTDLQYDMVRLGLGLYGISDDEMLAKELQQISSLKATISQIKEVDQGETIGYSRAGQVESQTRIATINIGYADGYSRAFSQGAGKVLIKGKLAPVIGNVCMDMIMVNIGHIENVKVGDEVTIFGEGLSVKELSEWSNTIPYEIITSISQRVKRVYYRD